MATTMNKKRLHILSIDIDMERQQHLIASIHCRWKFFWMCYVPSILLTLLCGVFAVITDNNYNNIIIIILSMLGVIWQSTSYLQLNYSSRANQHSIVAKTMKILQDDIDVHKGSSNRDNDDNDQQDNNSMFIEKITEKFDQAINSCNSVVPIKIQLAFSLLRDNISSKFETTLFTNDNDVITNRGNNPSNSSSFEEDIVVRKYQIAFNYLYYAITSSMWFPMKLPRSDGIVCKAIRNMEQGRQQLIEERGLNPFIAASSAIEAANRDPEALSVTTIGSSCSDSEDHRHETVEEASPTSTTPIIQFINKETIIK